MIAQSLAMVTSATAVSVEVRLIPFIDSPSVVFLLHNDCYLFVQRASDEEDNLQDSVSDARVQGVPGSHTGGQPRREADTQGTGHTPQVIVDAPTATGDVSQDHESAIDTSPVAEALAADKTEDVPCTGAVQVGGDLNNVVYVLYVVGVISVNGVYFIGC